MSAKLEGIAGLPDTGKTTITKFLENHGVQIISASAMLRRIGVELKLAETEDALTREQLSKIREQVGPNATIIRAIQIAQLNGAEQLYIYDSVRLKAEQESLLSAFPRAVVIGVRAPFPIRFWRATHSNRAGAPTFSLQGLKAYWRTTKNEQSGQFDTGEIVKNADIIINNIYIGPHSRELLHHQIQKNLRALPSFRLLNL